MTVRIRGVAVWFVAASILSVVATMLCWWAPVSAAETSASGTPLSPAALSWGFVAAALATGLSSLGAGIAVAAVGSAAIGALAEKPELLGRALIMVGLAEGIAIYGLIISILILNRIM